MELKGNISILIDRVSTTIQIHDHDAAMCFIEIKLSPNQLSAVLSRQADVPCVINVMGLDKVGKIHECSDFEFEIPLNIANSSHTDKLHFIAQCRLSDGWIADKNFSRQDSFFKKDGRQYARVIIRRWVDSKTV